MLIFLQRNLAWMLLAFALATALWVVVTTQQNPDVVDPWESIPVEARNLPTGRVLRSEIPAVQLMVAAPRDVQQELAALEARDLDRVVIGLAAQALEHVVQVAVLEPQLHDPLHELDAPRVGAARVQE